MGQAWLSRRRSLVTARAPPLAGPPLLRLSSSARTVALLRARLTWVLVGGGAASPVAALTHRRTRVHPPSPRHAPDPPSPKLPDSIWRTRTRTAAARSRGAPTTGRPSRRSTGTRSRAGGSSSSSSARSLMDAPAPTRGPASFLSLSNSLAKKENYSYLMEFLDAGARLRGQQQGYGGAAPLTRSATIGSLMAFQKRPKID